jgi:hypothetical protein
MRDKFRPACWSSEEDPLLHQEEGICGLARLAPPAAIYRATGEPCPGITLTRHYHHIGAAWRGRHRVFHDDD